MDFCIAKQPIVDRNCEFIGYELLYRQSINDTEALITEEINATDNVLSGYFLLNIYADDIAKTTCFINCDEDDIFNEKLTMLPVKNTVIEVLESCKPSPLMIEQIIHLKSLGYRIAYDDVTPDSPWQEYVSFADIIKVDVIAFKNNNLGPLIERCKRMDVKLLAEKVENEQEAIHYQSLGFDYFQGYYFCRPITLNFTVLAPTAISLLQAYSYLYSKDFDIDKFIQIIVSEPTLVSAIISRVNRHYRLVGKRISNIKHATSYIGLDELKKIFATVVASHICSAPSELIKNFSQSRAAFLEEVIQQMPVVIKQYEGYSVGLLSLFDALLKVEMSSLCSFMRLPANISEGLKNRTGFWGDMLSLCEAFETARLSQTKTLTKKYNLNYDRISQLYWKSYHFDAV
jgi:EAL and modified HD-GYP domain-containing signal transduction protein